MQRLVPASWNNEHAHWVCLVPLSVRRCCSVVVYYLMVKTSAALSTLGALLSARNKEDSCTEASLRYEHALGYKEKWRL